MAAEGHGQDPVGFEAPTLLQHLLRNRLVLPEIRGGGPCLERRQVAVQAGFVKAPS